MEDYVFDQLDRAKDKTRSIIARMEDNFARLKNEGLNPRLADQLEKFLPQLNEAVILLGQGIGKVKTSDSETGISEISRAQSLMAEVLLDWAKQLVGDGSWQLGLKVLRIVRDIFYGLGDWQGQARASVEIGDAHLMMGDYEVAQMAYLDAQRYLRKIGEEAGLAVTQQKLGTLALFMYQADEAEKQLKGALAFFESRGDRKRAEISRQLLQLTPDVRQGIPA